MKAGTKFCIEHLSLWAQDYYFDRTASQQANAAPQTEVLAREHRMNTPDWRSALAAELDELAFTHLFADAMAELAPNENAVVAETLCIHCGPEGDRKVYLHNLWGALPAEAEDRVAAVTHHVMAMLETEEESVPDIERIVPLVKDDQYMAQVLEMMGPDNELVTEPLAGLILEKVELQPGDTASMVLCGGNYEASMLLVDDLWQQMQGNVQGELVACAPSRDLLLFTGTETEGGLEALRGIADEVHEGGSYLVSKTILVRRNDRWEEFERRA
jgi:hypothetical protein